MARRTDPKEDDWRNVQDAKKRKQIQDRLAQRARRQRLREEKAGSTKTHTRRPPTASPPSSPEPSSQISHDLETVSTFSRSKSTSPIVLLPFDATNLTLSSATDHTSSSNSLLNQDLIPSSQKFPSSHTLPRILSPQSQPSPPLTVFAALYINGQILGLACSIYNCSRSPHPSPTHPLSLHPTETQLMTVHNRWVDRLPFPKLRDTLIRLQGVFDEEELVGDLYVLPSWRIEVGAKKGTGWESAAWDPRCWVMEEEWAKKWGWLMF